jgi:hypothetical protein
MKSARSYEQPFFRMALHNLCARGRGFLDDTAVDKMDGAISYSGVAWIVRDHADGRALPMQLLQ